MQTPTVPAGLAFLALGALVAQPAGVAVAEVYAPLAPFVGKYCGGPVVNEAGKGAMDTFEVLAGGTELNFHFNGWAGQVTMNGPQPVPGAKGYHLYHFKMTNGAFDNGYGGRVTLTPGPRNTLHAYFHYPDGDFKGDLPCAPKG
jgi:hypothetical protein